MTEWIGKIVRVAEHDNWNGCGARGVLQCEGGKYSVEYVKHDFNTGKSVPARIEFTEERVQFSDPFLDDNVLTVRFQLREFPRK